MHKNMALLLAICLVFLTACAAGGTTTLPSTSEAREAPQVSSTQPETAEESGEASMAQPEMEQEEEQLVGTATALPRQVIERMVGGSWKEGSPVALEELAYLTVPYVDFEEISHLGEMVVHESIAEEVLEIFAELYEAGYPIEKMVLIDDFGADDLASMAANNSSGFCARLILGTDQYSVHSYGRAVDINPVQNPYVVGADVYPEAAQEYMGREDVRPGMVVEGDVCYNAFVSRGWNWGGHWQNPDYQHFEKEQS